VLGNSLIRQKGGWGKSEGDKPREEKGPAGTKKLLQKGKGGNLKNKKKQAKSRTPPEQTAHTAP